MIGYFRRVPVREERIRAKVFGYFHKLQLALGFLARSDAPDLQSHTIPRSRAIHPLSTTGFNPRIAEVG